MCNLFLSLLTVLCFNCHGLEDVIHLDMVKSSAAYIFRRSTESDQLAISHVQNETGDVWKNAKNNMKCPVASGLTKEHMLAVYAYTAQYPRKKPFYRQFNDAVREYGADEMTYENNFKYKSYHYLLATALEELRSKSPTETKRVYRGIKHLAEGTEGSQMRFGIFASSSLDENVARKFINPSTKTNTIFNIRTQYGVRIQKYSCFPSEDEVLIPPYELFIVGKITSETYGNCVPLTGVTKEEKQMRLKIGKSGKLVVVPNEGIANSAFSGLWILTALICISG
ncbi:GPI-linked NAD(P)(+)--arginine ADP-ribosyltransferase 1-like [Rhincodon typus]|uniref:GPI-linked NAD(P)(+)--arginine ADP-ribosyltransferase 1-like n=1 Tax=Rhincodon typus TaxID=259920 RepID=UPI00202F0F5C|nr:GPI-linked NAD(P)(+)--arginine ADP-ribosyltransferase 1-like [Rhincodon typus]